MLNNARDNEWNMQYSIRSDQRVPQGAGIEESSAAQARTKHISLSISAQHTQRTHIFSVCVCLCVCVCVCVCVCMCVCVCEFLSLDL